MAIAPAKLHERDFKVETVAAVSENGDTSAQETALGLAGQLGAKVVASAPDGADLLVIGSKPGTSSGRVDTSAAALYLIEMIRCPVLVVPRGKPVRFGGAARRGTRALPSRGARVMPATDKGAATQRPPLVLVAEDATIVRLDLCRMLVERAGFGEVVEARDGEEAVALARERQPDLAILDVNMPKLDGIEAARRILAERPLPIVMLTAYADEAIVARAVAAGVYAYVVKPFREQDLLPAIRTAQARYEELLELQSQFASVSDALAAQKSVEQAKALLMRKEGLSAGDAFTRLLGASKLSGQPLEVIAGAVVAAFQK